MQNEFEKQVQQKMDELHFVPTPPVWEKIEAQIRRKKERRRLLLWLPLLLLLTGSAIWWMTSASSDKTKTDLSTLAPSSADHSSTTQQETNKQTISSSAENTSTQPQSVTETPAVTIQNADALQSATIESSAITSAKSISKKSRKHSTSSDKANSTTAKAGAHPTDTLDFDYAMQHETLEQAARSLNTSTDSKFSSSISYSPSVPYFSSSFKLTPLHPAAFRLPVLIDQHGEITSFYKKTSIGLSLSAGWSGMTQGTGAFAKSVYSGPQTTNGTLPRSPLITEANPLPISGHGALSIGVAGERRLSPKLSLGVGLGYSYFSTLIGEKSDSGGRSPVRLIGTLSGTKQTAAYTNRFHFISLPVSLHLSAFRHLPLDLHTGLNVNRLVSTNALQYNYATQVYDKIDAHRTQLSFNIGADYRLMKMHSEWRFGPQFEYGISRLSSTGPHLYNFSLRLQYFIRKRSGRP